MSALHWAHVGVMLVGVMLGSGWARVGVMLVGVILGSVWGTFGIKLGYFWGQVGVIFVASGRMPISTPSFDRFGRLLGPKLTPS